MFIVAILCCTALLHALQVLFTKFFNQNYNGDSKASPFVFAVMSGTALALLTWAIGGFSFSPSWLTVALACSKAFLVLLFNVAQINAASRGSFAIMSVFMHGGGIVVPMIVSMIALSQSLTPVQYCAVAVLIGSLFLLNARGVKGERAKRGYWMWCILLSIANGGCGALMSTQANLLDGAERTEMIAISNAVSAVLALICLAFIRKRSIGEDFKKINKRAAGWLCLYFAVAVIAANLYSYAFSRANTTIVTCTDIGGALVLSALFALVIFKDKLSKLQWLGMVTSVASIIVLSI